MNYSQKISKKPTIQIIDSDTFVLTPVKYVTFYNLAYADLKYYKSMCDTLTDINKLLVRQNKMISTKYDISEEKFNICDDFSNEQNVMIKDCAEKLSKSATQNVKLKKYITISMGGNLILILLIILI